MKGEEVSRYRSEIIEDFIGLEGLIGCLISIHYLGRLSLAFYHEVLYDEYFSFGLKVRILEKILYSEGKDAREKVEKLRRANNIRNIFAHCGVTRYEYSSGDSYVPNPRKPDEGLDFEVLHAEFMEIVPTLRDYLLEKASAKGAKIRINERGQ